MATSTSPAKAYTDDHGIERATKQQQGGDDGLAQKAPAVDHLMRMNERFGAQGGNQFAAGITYFSVLSLFPLLMLVFAGLGFFLNARPDLMQQIQDQVTESLEGDMGSMVNDLIQSAIDQRGAVAGIGLLTTLWSGLGWMNNLRVGVSAMWNLDADEGGNFVTKKLWDLLGLIGLIVLFVVAFAVTALGVSGWTDSLLDYVGLGEMPGARVLVWVVGLLVGVLANFLVMLWVVMFLPRTKVPVKSGMKGALLGAIIFEVIKQFAGVIIGAMTGNPAGAIFGPLISLMIVLYLIWRVVLYVSAWTATTEESLRLAPAELPEPAVINVRAGAARQESRNTGTGKAVGVGAAIGALGVGVVSLLTRD
ncbi:YhjD/YihY/BrkB family envelope integrity protein [Corynebacterium sp. p3-SID1056]|uniref:YhjD/YihY/BrkB family envelope integrity protein n=1 Tax=Corynebacterium sp. p3-SID1056 TaxID=2916092 RepID=UPI0021A8D567|nr:YhjD/YihY/BrkB family envelope integrity protein [Corynebacterium sp. p3-SID1056]MCT2338499.1 YihY family inner membrane protein [Corynebacterium sp. p3-SID1056]